ncbi:malto-oligosyltrehalose synthase [Pseudolysinimonas kribbensis]|uniref:Malto-oligosyltrehalose synthase n=1 Tax=Pseudolysinimonas kribbensis TaxID=433641 RepID=A0ABQ6KC85_9MICO|nr:malto-oligosyltrehalose synthase [Pseudolysinimonas kribbensis]
MPGSPISTYRLQVTAGFTLADAADATGYLRDLGVDWVYLSPLLEATPGSTHGYDVVDPARVDPERGGVDALDSLSRAAHANRLGVLVDIVPNHVGVARPEVNAAWWDVLQHGADAEHAAWFDIDGDLGGGRVRIPVLGESLADAAASGALRVEDGELRYHEHRYPLAHGTEAPDVLAVHAAQHYELVDWRRADAELNYRRFFAVSDLAAVRVELPEVFAATHREILRWVREGIADGLRVDHPDGLADPGGYLDALAAATGDAYVLVEKILEHGERLPPFWATAGTTGYDALAEFDRVLVDPEGLAALDRLDPPVAWDDLVHDMKREVADGILRSEVARLAREAAAREAATPWPKTPSAGGSPLGVFGQEGDGERVEDATAEVLACFPVYRSYLPYGREHLDAAIAEATRRRPDLASSIAALAPVLSDPAQPVAIRFQQTSGMVMAKGVEDRAFYRVSRLASLTEVGADPSEFAIDVDEFHARQERRLAEHPLAMTTLSTHDTKRGEDTRARITAIAEAPGEWAAFVAGMRQRHPLGDPVFENLLWQSVAGSWPRERAALHGYAEKAAREAGAHTSWQHPDEEFERRMHALVDACFDDASTAAALDGIVALLEPAGWSNGLAAKLLQLTGPGVPDVYQGSELWERSLVDPDNRRPVDLGERRALLARLDAGWRPRWTRPAPRSSWSPAARCDCAATIRSSSAATCRSPRSARLPATSSRSTAAA